MSRDLIDENYYMTTGGLIPVKWTAPELLLIKLVTCYKILCSIIVIIGTYREYIATQLE